MKPNREAYPRDTLGYHYRMAEALLGPESPALEYLAGKAQQSPRAFDEPVIAHEVQVIALLAHIHFSGLDL